MSVEQGVVRDSEAVSLTLKDALQGILDERAAEVEEEEGTANDEEAEKEMKRWDETNAEERAQYIEQK